MWRHSHSWSTKYVTCKLDLFSFNTKLYRSCHLIFSVIMNDVNSCRSDSARLQFRVEKRISWHLNLPFVFLLNQETNYNCWTKRADHCIIKLPAILVGFFNWAIYFAAELKLNNTRYLFNIYHLMVFDRYHQNLNHNKRHISFWRRGIHIRNDHRSISHSVILYIMLENFKMRTCVRANKRCWCAPFSINQMSYSIPRKLFHIVGFLA